jgi:hypothetical protein
MKMFPRPSIKTSTPFLCLWHFSGKIAQVVSERKHKILPQNICVGIFNIAIGYGAVQAGIFV